MDCVDILHQTFPYQPIYYQVSNFVFVWNILILIGMYGTGGIGNDQLSHLTITGLILFVFRYVMSMVTPCRVDNTPMSSPHVWHMISLRLAISSLVTMYIWQTPTSWSIKGASLLFSIVVAFMDVLSRTHYSSDVVFTLVIVFLCGRAVKRLTSDISHIG